MKLTIAIFKLILSLLIFGLILRVPKAINLVIKLIMSILGIISRTISFLVEEIEKELKSIEQWQKH